MEILSFEIILVKDLIINNELSYWITRQTPANRELNIRLVTLIKKLNEINTNDLQMS